ncbi:MAG: hypothetical protein ACQEQJ_07360 [Halobacteriota archaeon]
MLRRRDVAAIVGAGTSPLLAPFSLVERPDAAERTPDLEVMSLLDRPVYHE